MFLMRMHFNASIMHYSIYSSPLPSLRHATIRPQGSAPVQQSTDSSVGARRSMSLMG